jgi:hypothetical protein
VAGATRGEREAGNERERQHALHVTPRLGTSWPIEPLGRQPRRARPWLESIPARRTAPQGPPPSTPLATLLATSPTARKDDARGVVFARRDADPVSWVTRRRDAMAIWRRGACSAMALEGAGRDRKKCRVSR